jgi:hypothetical protein
VQVKQVLSPGADRYDKEEKEHVALLSHGSKVEQLPYTAYGYPEWQLPVNDKKVLENAIVESVPDNLDRGAVASSFATNDFDERQAIVEPVVPDLEFQNRQYNARLESDFAARRAAAADRAAVAEALRADHAQIDEAVRKRIATQKLAAERIERAKTDMIAHDIKARQAEHWSLAGRHLGEQEGVNEAARLHHDWEEDNYDAAVARRNAEIIAAKAARIRYDKDVINDHTAYLEARDRDYAERAKYVAEAVERHAAAKTALAEDAILGAEGMKDTLTLHIADNIADAYRRGSEHAQRRIDQAATGNWPVPHASIGDMAEPVVFAGSDGLEPEDVDLASKTSDSHVTDLKAAIKEAATDAAARAAAAVAGMFKPDSESIS